MMQIYGVSQFADMQSERNIEARSAREAATKYLKRIWQSADPGKIKCRAYVMGPLETSPTCFNYTLTIKKTVLVKSATRSAK